MSTLAPSDTKKLIEILNYGGDYEKIVKISPKADQTAKKCTFI